MCLFTNASYTCHITCLNITLRYVNLYFLRDFILQKNFMKNFNIKKTRTIKYLKEEDIPSGISQINELLFTYFNNSVFKLSEERKFPF